MNYVGWDEVEEGAILNSFKAPVNEDLVSLRPEEREYSQFNTHTISISDWRVVKPIYNADACINCQNCWIYCPDSAIISRDKLMTGLDYDHCKGCGICAEVCPTNPKSLIMFDNNKDESEALSGWPEKVKKEKKDK